MTKIGDNLGHNDITHKYTYMTCIIVPSWTFHIFQLNNRTWSATVICAYVANVAFLFFIFVRFGELLLYSPFISTDLDSNGYYLLFGLTSNLCTIYNRARAHVLWPTYIHICNDSELYTIMLVTFEPAMKWISSLQSKDICLQRLRSPQSHSNVAFLGFFFLLTDEASFFIHFVQIHCDYRDYPMKKKNRKIDEMPAHRCSFLFIDSDMLIMLIMANALWSRLLSTSVECAKNEIWKISIYVFLYFVHKTSSSKMLVLGSDGRFDG